MAFAIRHSSNTFRAFRSVQCVQSIRNIRMSAKLRSEQAIEKLKEKNPYFEKYADKIASLQQASPEEFLNRLESIETKNKPKKVEKPRCVRYLAFHESKNNNCI